MARLLVSDGEKSKQRHTEEGHRITMAYAQGGELGCCHSLRVVPKTRRWPWLLARLLPRIRQGAVHSQERVVQILAFLRGLRRDRGGRVAQADRREALHPTLWDVFLIKAPGIGIQGPPGS